MAKAFGIQRDRVLKYMVDFNSITAAQAIADLGVYSLSSRISELKKLGYEIKKIWGKGEEPLQRRRALCRILYCDL